MIPYTHSDSSTLHDGADDAGDRAPALRHQHPPIGMVATSVLGHPVTLYLKERMITLHSNEFGVVDESGTTQCRVHGEIAKIRGSGFDVQVGTVKNDKLILDRHGRHLFLLRRKAVSLNQVHRAFDRSGNIILMAKSKYSFTKAIVVASIRNAYDDAKIDIEVVGRYRDGGAAEIRVVKTRDVIAKISRHVGGHYIVEVAAGVDLSMITALAMIHHSSSNQNSRAWTD